MRCMAGEILEFYCGNRDGEWMRRWLRVVDAPSVLVGCAGMAPDCATNKVQDWSDLFLKADVPAGTSIAFDMWTGTTAAELTNRSYSRIATVTSISTQCANNNACKDQTINGVERDGFCGIAQQCQFIDPPRIGGYCTATSQCPMATQATARTTTRSAIPA
jgi:hypothetical protein